MTNQVYNFYIVDPLKEAPGSSPSPTGYRYDPIDQLSRFALSAFAERALAQHTDSTESNVMAGVIAPPDVLDGQLYNTPTQINNQTDARTYLNNIVYLPQDLTQQINASAKRGFIVTTPGGPVECYAVFVNHTRQAGAERNSVLSANNGAINAAKGTILGSLTSVEAGAGDTVELFLALASDVLTAIPSPSPAQAYSVLNPITRFEFTPSGETYSWIFSQRYTINSLDDTPAGAGNTVVMDAALKPKAASDGTFTVTVVIKNPTISANLDFGLQVAVNNKTQNGSLLATDPSLVWVDVDTSYGGVNEGQAVLTITDSPHAVVENDELQFYVRVLGDNQNLRTFDVTSPAPQVTTVSCCLFVTGTNITVDDGINVDLTLDLDYGLEIDNVNVQSNLYQNNETSLVPNSVLDAHLVVDNPGLSITLTAGEAVDTVTSGSFNKTFTVGDWSVGPSNPSGKMPYAGAQLVIKITALGNPVIPSTNLLDFFPRFDAPDVTPATGQGATIDTADSDGTTQETIPFSALPAARFTSTAGVVSVNLDLNTEFQRTLGLTTYSTYPNNFALVNALVASSGPVRFFGDILNGPPPGSGTDLADSRYELTLVVQGESFGYVAPLLLDSDTDNNLEYDFIADSSLPGWTRDLTVGDVVNLQLRDTAQMGNPIVPFGDSSPINGTIENGMGSFPAGTITFTITQPMITAGSLSESGVTDENLILENEEGALTSVSIFTFHGIIRDSMAAPIAEGASLLIHNVDKNLSKVGLVGTAGGNSPGEYEIEFAAADFALAPGTPVASAGDTIRYVLFEDLFPFLDSVNPAAYPDPASEDTVVTPFTGDTVGPDVAVTPDLVGPPIIQPGVRACQAVLTLPEIQFASGEPTPRGEKTEDFVADFEPTVSEEIVVQSTPVQAGQKIPTRAMPYIDVEFPENVTGGVPFEFELEISNNANDAVPRFEPVLSLPNLATVPPGRFQIPGSTQSLRLHVFGDISKTAPDYAVALRIRMKRNDSTGPFKLFAWGVRYWSSN